MSKKKYPPASNHEQVLDEEFNKGFKGGQKMVGKVRRIVEEKGFGFIKGDMDAIDYFFHKSAFEGHWHDLVNDVLQNKNVPVEFDSVTGTKGPRAENVHRLDNGVVMERPEDK